MSDDEPTQEMLDRWEKRAPGWKIRCLKCGFTEPWGKYGIRLFACGTKYTIGRCSACGRWRFFAIERKSGS